MLLTFQRSAPSLVFAVLVKKKKKQLLLPSNPHLGGELKGPSCMCEVFLFRGTSLRNACNCLRPQLYLHSENKSSSAFKLSFELYSHRSSKFQIRPGGYGAVWLKPELCRVKKRLKSRVLILRSPSF